MSNSRFDGMTVDEHWPLDKQHHVTIFTVVIRSASY